MADDRLASVIKLKKVSPLARLPKRATSGSAGLDLFCPYNVTIQPGERLKISTDLQLVALPPGSYLRVASRSGLAIKQSLDVCGGVIDADYRGVIAVILANQGKEARTIKAGNRFAQMICERYLDVIPIIERADADSRHPSVVTKQYSHDARGEKGFGSSGDG